MWPVSGPLGAVDCGGASGADGGADGGADDRLGSIPPANPSDPSEPDGALSGAEGGETVGPVEGSEVTGSWVARPPNGHGGTEPGAPDDGG